MKPSLLYLTHRVPFPPDKGDRIRNFHLLRQLARDYRVSLGCIADEPVAAETRTILNDLCDQVAIVPASPWFRWIRSFRSAIQGRSLSEGAFFEPRLVEIIDDWQAQEPFAAAILSATSMVSYLRRPSFERVPCFVDVVDVDSQKWLDFARASRFPKSWLYRFEGARVRRIERELPSWVQASALVSQAEGRIFEAIAGTDTATVATNGVDLDYFSPQSAEETTACAFVGALDYLPNVDAAVWFAHSVWPKVLARFSHAEFWLIGRKPLPIVQKLAELPGIKLIGQVPDVRPHLARAAIAVVPMRLSRGLQNKVLEAMAMGKATIVAPPALAALTAVPGQHLLSAVEPEEWANAIIGLFENSMERKHLGERARKFVEENHHWDQCLRPLTDPIARVAGVFHSSSETLQTNSENRQDNSRLKESLVP